MQEKSHSEEVWLVSWLYKTLWMRENKKNYQAFDHTLLSSMTVCVSRAGPVCVCVWCEVSGWGGGGGDRAVF